MPRKTSKPRPRTFTENAEAPVATVLTPLRCKWCDSDIPTGQASCASCCPRCGTQHPAGAERCPNCHGFLPGNQAARTHGLSARHVPADLRMDADQLKDAIVSDLGGLDNLSALEISYVRKIADVEVTARLLLADIIRTGLLTSGGRVRDVYPAFLAALDRFDRLASRVGLKRRQRHIDPLEAVRQAVEAAQ